MALVTRAGLVLLAIVAATVLGPAATARAQAGQPDPAEPPGPIAAPPDSIGASTGTEPGVDDGQPALQVDVWTEWEVRAAPGAKLLESAETVRALLAADMRTRAALTAAAREELREICARFDYHLVSIEVERPGAGVVRAILNIEPRLIVRSVKIKVAQSWLDTLYRDPLLRRMRLRAGEVLEANQAARDRQLRGEAQHLQSYLQDEGFFEAVVTVEVERSQVNGARMMVKAVLGPSYQVGKILIEREAELAISGEEIRGLFAHHRLNIDFAGIHWGKKRFSRTQHQADVAALTKLYQRRGYPAVRVQTVFDPKTSWDRDTRTVSFKIRIDERRRVDVLYEGNDPAWFPSDALDDRLTFNDASSADDCEADASARAIQAHYQARGWFDAAVTWERERLRVGDSARGGRLIDRIKYRIDAGQRRALSGVELVGNRAIDTAELRQVITTGAARSSLDLLSSPTRVTAEQLAGDVERLRLHYRARGYLAAKITVAAAPRADALGDAATTAALLAAERAPTELWVRFTIDEGPRSVLERVDVTFTGEHVATEAQVLAQLDLEPGGPYLHGDLEQAGSRLQTDWFWSIGRPRAEVTLEVTPGSAPGQLVATYAIEEHQELRIGKVVVRGNFNTERWVILGELRFPEGALLTRDLYTSGMKRLRATGLFSAVKVTPIDFEETREGTIHVLVKVEERDDHRSYVDLEGGRSSQKGTFVKLRPVFPNPLGNGISAEFSVTCSIGRPIGLSWEPCAMMESRFSSYDALVRVPRWWMRRFVGFTADAEASAFSRKQETERFGFLTSLGGSLGLARSWQRIATPTQDGRAVAATLRYDFRKVDRQEDAVRIAGNNGNQARSQVANRTGAIGIFVTWDQRVGQRGNVNPLAPERGFKLEAGISYAHRYLLGQDTFLKLRGAAQRIWTLNDRLQLRIDGRYDQGVPLGGAVLLPEVERYFAGGDDTVRGYREDRLLIERIETAVPPLGEVTQVEIRPSGGNIRVIAGIDSQVTLWNIKGIPIASALFVDAGAIVNTFAAFDAGDIRPSVGIALIRALTQFGGLSLEYAVPMLPRDHGEQLGRWHFSVALRY